MSNITPTNPSFVFGYWRPWNEDSSFINSYLDYAKDVSLVKYGADTVGNYINAASKEQIKAINQVGQELGRGVDILSEQISDMNDTLGFINRNLDIQIEQQKLSNLLLDNIVKLLRVPDSEKERQHCIELGIKFFVNAKKDSDLYADALEELLRAEYLMKQDYFVLHRIGCIYLHVKEYIDLEKALDYFLRAAKYASVESDISAVKLANILVDNFNTVNNGIYSSEKQIGLLAAASYEKAAFAAYAMGHFEDAVSYQTKAHKFNASPQNTFLLAKYQIRNKNKEEGLKNLDLSINQIPHLAIAVFKEIDLLNEPDVIKLIASKNKVIDNTIKELLEKWKKFKLTDSDEVTFELNKILKKSYEVKAGYLFHIKKRITAIKVEFDNLRELIDNLIRQINATSFSTFDENKISNIVDELEQAKQLSLNKMQVIHDNYVAKISNDKIKIGSSYGGGIVCYLDYTGRHGLVCADKDFGTAQWGSNGDIPIGANGKGIANGAGMENTWKIYKLASTFIEKGFWRNSEKTLNTGARLCIESNYNGYNDWYLPSTFEWKIIAENLYQKRIGNFNTEYNYYWSSEECYTSAFFINLNVNPNHHSFFQYASKNREYNIRAVRTF